MLSMRVSLAEWARRAGVPYTTAHRWFRRGQLPPGVHADRLPSGSIVVHLDPLSELDVHQLAERLHQAGYRFAETPALARWRHEYRA